jgi:hypothetical protein
MLLSLFAIGEAGAASKANPMTEPALIRNRQRRSRYLEH